MIVSAISVVVSSRLVASCTTPSLSSTMASSFGVATGRFSQAFNSPCKIFWRSNRSRRPSFLITMYGISSIRSYVVNRRSHFRHSRRRRMVSPVRPSRESITLSSRCAQKGHFNWGCLRGAFLFRVRTTKARATQEGGASPVPTNSLWRLGLPVRLQFAHFRVRACVSVRPATSLRGEAEERRQKSRTRTLPATESWRRPLPALFLLHRAELKQRLKAPGRRHPRREVAQRSRQR